MNILRNKQALIGIIIAVVILIGAAGVLLLGKNKSSINQPITNEKSQKSGSDLFGLLKSGKTQQCNFSYEDGDNSTVGVVYISGDKMRTDITNTLNGKESEMSLIRRGDENYIWGSDFPNKTGFKMTLSIDEFSGNEQTKNYLDPSKKVDYDCQGWTVDASSFEPPTDIKFTDFSGVLEGVVNTKSNVNTDKSSQCGVCDSLPADAKTACRTQLSC